MARSVAHSSSREEGTPDVFDAIAPSPPHLTGGQPGKVLEPMGETIVWPWERSNARNVSGVLNPADVASMLMSLPPRACDGLVARAMAASHHGGQLGENTTGVRAWKAEMARLREPDMRILDPNAPLAAKLYEEQLCMRFVCTLVEERGIAANTAANYFGAVQGWHERVTGVKLCGGLKLARLPQMLKGLRRILGDPQRKLRRGVAAQALRRAMDMVLDPECPAHANIRAALSCAFQGLLRSAEFCDDGKRGKSLAKLLERLPSRADISQLDDEQLVIMFCPCKNMAHLSGKTVPIVIGAGGEHIDAVAEVRNLVRVDRAPLMELKDVPLFRDPSSNKPLTVDFMRAMVKQLMRLVGEDPEEFGTHSLRIGGATALFAAGTTPTVIRTMGRWSSDCYRLYVRACYEQSKQWTSKAGSTVVTDIQGDYDEVDYY